MFRFLKLFGLSLLITELGMASPVYASQWIYLTESQDGYSFYLDFDSMKGTGSERTFWAREESPSGITRSLAKWIVNCEHRQFGLLEVIEYSSNGSFLSHYQSDNAIGGESDLIPGTIGEAYYKYICNRITYQSPVIKPSNQIAANQYPKSVCGDAYPSSAGEYQFYPVFADYSAGTLDYIQSNLCRDAFVIKRENGMLSVQVASFRNRSRAVEFASFLQEQVGSSEIGNPKTISIP